MVNLPSERGLQQQPSAQFCWLLCSGAHVTFLDDISRLLIPIEKQKNLSLQQKLVSTKIHVIAALKFIDSYNFASMGISMCEGRRTQR